MATEVAEAEQTTLPSLDRGGVVAVSAAHALHDAHLAFLAPVLPLLIEKLSLSLTLAGSLSLFTSLPSLLQPFIGYVADRSNLRYFAVLAPAVTSTVMSLIGIAPSLGVLMLMLTIAGASSAAFHAPGPVIIARLSGRRIGAGLSVFTMGGELARTVGPLVIVSAVGWWGLEGTYRLVVIGWAATAFLFWRLRKVPLNGPRRAQPAFGRILAEMRPALGAIAGISIARAFLLSSLSVYLPTFMMEQGQSLFFGGAALAVLEAAGIAGTLAGGTLSDRWGRPTVLALAFLTSPLLMLLLLAVQGWLIFAVLLLLGFTSLSTMPVMMAIIMDRFVETRTTANGVFGAISFTASSIATLAIGFVGDHWGLRVAFAGSAAIMLLGVPVALALRRPPATEEAPARR